MMKNLYNWGKELNFAPDPIKMKVGPHAMRTVCVPSLILDEVLRGNRRKDDNLYDLDGRFEPHI